MFIFRFETLLATRRHAEDALQKELSDAKRALSAEQFIVRCLTRSSVPCILRRAAISPRR